MILCNIPLSNPDVGRITALDKSLGVDSMGIVLLVVEEKDAADGCIIDHLRGGILVDIEAVIRVDA